MLECRSCELHACEVCFTLISGPGHREVLLRRYHGTIFSTSLREVAPKTQWLFFAAGSPKTKKKCCLRLLLQKLFKPTRTFKSSIRRPSCMLFSSVFLRFAFCKERQQWQKHICCLWSLVCQNTAKRTRNKKMRLLGFARSDSAP